MSGWGKVFKTLRNRLFGKDESEQKSPPPKVEETRFEAKRVAVIESPPSVSAPPLRDPYFVQIGLDFGTAFTKCVCRDVIVDKAWVHIPEHSAGEDLPFLVPSPLTLRDGVLRHPSSKDGNYLEDGLPHIKLALEKVAEKRWKDPVLKPFKELMVRSGIGNTMDDLSEMVAQCAVFLLGGILGGVRRDIRSRLLDFGAVSEDYIAVNMAIPVANAESLRVRKLFHKVLCRSWVLSEQLVDFPEMTWNDLVRMTESSKQQATEESIGEACFIYPEASANVQGFVRSRTSREGLYLFSDTGAGTVDQSVFLFIRKDGVDHLTYLHASVLPLGSSKIEYLAASKSMNLDFARLEQLRRMKERGTADSALDDARELIEKELHVESYSSLGVAKKKLFQPRQLNGLTVIFGGGGDCEYPYHSAVRKQFDGALFRREAIEERRIRRDLFDIGMPIPRDLEISSGQRSWVRRLSVAYGLSFGRFELASFTYPSELSNPEPIKLRKTGGKRATSVSKDVC